LCAWLQVMAPNRLLKEYRYYSQTFFKKALFLIKEQGFYFLALVFKLLSIINENNSHRP
jgi:hypothetical protein